MCTRTLVHKKGLIHLFISFIHLPVRSSLEEQAKMVQVLEVHQENQGPLEEVDLKERSLKCTRPVHQNPE